MLYFYEYGDWFLNCYFYEIWLVFLWKSRGINLGVNLSGKCCVIMLSVDLY